MMKQIKFLFIALLVSLAACDEDDKVVVTTDPDPIVKVDKDKEEGDQGDDENQDENNEEDDSDNDTDTGTDGNDGEVENSVVIFYLRNVDDSTVKLYIEQWDETLTNWKTKTVELKSGEQYEYIKGTGDAASLLAGADKLRDIRVDYNCPFKPTIIKEYWVQIKNWKKDEKGYYLRIMNI